MATIWERVVHSVLKAYVLFVLCMFVILVVIHFIFEGGIVRGSDCTSSWSLLAIYFPLSYNCYLESTVSATIK